MEQTVQGDVCVLRTTSPTCDKDSPLVTPTRIDDADFRDVASNLPPISVVVGAANTIRPTLAFPVDKARVEQSMRLDNLIDPPGQPPSLCRVSCPTCGSSFKKRANLKRHIQTVHARQKDFKCPVCIASFSQKAHRDRHVRTVHGKEKKHSCHICSKNFTLRFSLERHFLRFHSEVPWTAGLACGSGVAAAHCQPTS